MVNRGEWNSGDVPTSPLPTIPHRQRLRKNRQGTLTKRAAMGRMVRIQLNMLGVSSVSRRLLTAPILSSIVINRAAIASPAEQKEDYMEDFLSGR